MQIARIRHAAPIPKQTTPKAIFSTKPSVIPSPRVSLRSARGQGQWTVGELICSHEPDPFGLSIPLLGIKSHIKRTPGPSSIRL
jgi:hypothetical protein